jgi:hypothetical protein
MLKGSLSVLSVKRVNDFWLGGCFIEKCMSPLSIKKQLDQASLQDQNDN